MILLVCDHISPVLRSFCSCFRSLLRQQWFSHRLESALVQPEITVVSGVLTCLLFVEHLLIQRNSPLEWTISHSRGSVWQSSFTRSTFSRFKSRTFGHVATISCCQTFSIDSWFALAFLMLRGGHFTLVAKYSEASNLPNHVCSERPLQQHILIEIIPALMPFFAQKRELKSKQDRTEVTLNHTIPTPLIALRPHLPSSLLWSLLLRLDSHDTKGPTLVWQAL